MKMIVAIALALSSSAILAATNPAIEATYKASVSQCKAGPKAERKACLSEAKKVKLAALKCPTCGVITNVNVTKEKGDNSVVGMAAGAVAGGVLGHQVGNGKGKDLATVVGAVGGAVAGNEVAKHINATETYEYTVKLNDGTTKVITYSKQEKNPGFDNGQKVKVEGDTLVAQP